MNDLVKTFEGQPIKVKTDNGKTLINLTNTARVCGLTQKEELKEVQKFTGEV